MKFAIAREQLTKALQFVGGVVERKQSLPILSNVLFKLDDQQLFVVGTDLEVELTSQVNVLHNDKKEQTNEITIPGRKLLDICRSLPEQAKVEVSIVGEGKLTVSSGLSRFSLSTLPADDFPLMNVDYGKNNFSITQKELHQLLNATHFAMAQQDVRYYLNGLFFELNQSVIKTVATDGHRLALRSLPFDSAVSVQPCILPRKAVLELLRLLNKDSEDMVQVSVGTNAIRLVCSDFVFVSRLVEGNFPDYRRVLPKNGDKIVLIDKEIFRHMLSRVAVLSNEKYHAVHLQLKPGLLKVSANNNEHEEAHDEIAVDYHGPDLEIVFNVNYLLDAVSAIPDVNVKMILANNDSSVLIEPETTPNMTYVVMPMCL